MRSTEYGIGPCLEVIVTSAAEAVEAEAGGATRLELVRNLACGGLTPTRDVIEAVLAAVSLPVRVMVRNRPALDLLDEEIPALSACVKSLMKLPIDGLVIGGVQDGRADLRKVRQIIGEVDCRLTFHRAFDEICDKEEAIAALKSIPQVDRILTSGGDDTWQVRRGRLCRWQSAGSPEIHILVAVGLAEDALSQIQRDTSGFEFHIGRAAREGHTTTGKVRRELIRRLLSPAE